MNTMLLTLAFAAAFACVALMGYAVQRGATCTVAAVDELVDKRRGRRLLAMAEASPWVAGGLLIAQHLGLLPSAPTGYAVSGYTIVGGVLLGGGAWLAGACVFGAIARLGSGQWAYVLVPTGYFVGCATLSRIFPPTMHERLPEPSRVLQAPVWVAVLFVTFAAWRIARLLRGGVLQTLASRVWAPHMATVVIGVTFVLTLLLVGGTWGYTDVLAELARGMANNVTWRVLLLVALFGGALLGGWTAGRWTSTRPTAAQVARCFAGGALMAWGTLLIPGANDGLILVGMPLLRPYAWLAFGTMCVTIAAVLLISRRLSPAAPLAPTARTDTRSPSR